MFVEFDVAVADAFDDSRRHFGNDLAGFALEIVFHQPFADEFLRKLLLGFAFGKAFFISFEVEITGRVRGMDFVHQVDLAVVLAELIFRIHQNQTALFSDFRTAFEESQGVFFQYFIFFRRSQSACEDFFLGNVLVVLANLGFSSRGDDGFGETLVLAHTFGKFHTANLANTALISTPCATTQITTDNHFDREAFTTDADSYHWIRRSQLPVRTDVRSRIQELGSNLVQHLSLVRNTFRQDYVESRDTVGSDHNQQVVIHAIYIADFAVIDTLLSGEIEICFN